MTQYTNQAKYLDQMIPEYQGNPLIEALPPILSNQEIIQTLAEDALYNSGERELDAQYRMHCIYRLFRYFQPLEQHIDIAQRISRSIRQGYLYRNPMFSEHAGSLSDSYNILRDKGTYQMLKGNRSRASGFTIIGVSGVGKSTAVERILATYPQTIIHSSYKKTPLSMMQVVWLKLDCPHDGSLKQLCYQFFHELDQAVGTGYFDIYMKRTYTLDALLIIMTQLVRQFQIGLLVIDEIQHLSEAKGGGSDKMLNFFVTLVNTIGVPVVLIGTTKAMSLLQGEFRQARRGSGQGDLIWDRMAKDAAWDLFVRSMWRYQWTRNAVPFNAELSEVLYDESQGIIDIAVKLYAIVQIDAITSGQESFSVEDIHRTAVRKLALVKPMLDALRSGDKKKILKYGDITPISIEDYLSSYQTPVKEIERKVPEQKMSVMEQAVIKLMEVEVAPGTARKLAGRVVASHKNPVTVGQVFKEAYQLYLSGTAKKDEKEEKQEATDIRGSDSYDELKQSGLVDDTKW